MNKPIRILHVVVNMNSGGIENMLMNLYRRIDRNKIQFDFLVHTNECCFFEDEILKLGGVIHRISPLRLTNLNAYSKEVDAFFKKNKYKIVHSHRGSASYFALKQAKKNNIPVRILHSHEAPLSLGSIEKSRILLILLLKYLSNKTITHRFACGNDAGIWMFGNKREFSVLNNAIEANKFSFNQENRNLLRKEFGLENELVIGNVSRFNRQKNHIFLLKIFKSIIEKQPNSKLVLIGDGELKNEIVTHAKELNILNKIRFLGVRSDVSNLLQMLDVFVMPSLFEGLPVTLIEAQTSGLKVFASDAITREVALTDNIDFLSLNQTAEFWADQILKSVPYVRQDKTDVIKANGYDIVESTKRLQDFYMAQINSIH